MQRPRSFPSSVFAALAVGATLLAAVAPASAQRPREGEDESAALVEEGRLALRAGQLDAASRALDQAIALNPRRVESYVLRAAVFAARKQYVQGVLVLRRAEVLAPSDPDVRAALGAQLVLSGDSNAGLPILLDVTKSNPSRYDAQILLGRHFHATGKWPSAIAAFEAYFKHRPKALAGEDARHRIELADAYLRYRQPKRALSLFEQARDARPNDVRARIGVAWATASIDCRRARPLLRDLEELAATHPEVWLVDGLCALSLGDPSAALAQGRKYLEKSGQARAAGHALVGEAHLARGQLAEAKKALDLARTLEPERRRWSVRLAVVLRRSGDHKAARDALDLLGPPSIPSVDPDWYTELGEALIATGDAKQAVERIAPALPDLPGDAAVRTVVGAAQVASGQAEAAITTLADAESITSQPRSRKLLVDALTTVATSRIGSGEIDDAEALLARANDLEGTPLVWRSLGIAKLAKQKPAEASVFLERAAKADPSGLTWMLAGRAHALAGDVAKARGFYEKAVASDRASSAESAIDWAASELAGGDPLIAVTALERTAAAAKGGPLAARHRQALAIARHAAGVAALRAGNGAKAVDLLQDSYAVDAQLSTKCDLALAHVVAGESTAALRTLRALTGQSCPFPPPADLQAAPILIAFTEGRSNVRRASRALDRLTTLSGRSSGPALGLLNTAIRVVALEAAQDAYRGGRIAEARKYLTSARGASSRIGVDELAHNLAVLDLAEGNVDAAIAALERLVPKLPEAAINLGIAYERKGNPAKALDAWRRARRAGARFAPLAEWIELKERIYGTGASGGAGGGGGP